MGTYRATSARGFNLNTHPRSRIWTVLDGELRSGAAPTLMGAHGTPSLLKNLDSSWVGTLLPRGQARGLLPATTPAQEFGEWTRLSDERSTTCGNGGIAPRHHARPECSLTEEYASLRPSPRSLTRHVNLLLFATTTGSCYTLLLVCSGTHPCSRIPSGLFCAIALLHAHRELSRRRASTPSHTKFIQQNMIES